MFFRSELLEEIAGKSPSLFYDIFNEFGPLIEGTHFQKRIAVYLIYLQEPHNTTEVVRYLIKPRETVLRKERISLDEKKLARAKEKKSKFNSLSQTLDRLEEERLVKRLQGSELEYLVSKEKRKDGRTEAFYLSSLEPIRPLTQYLIKSKMWKNANLKKEDLRKIEKLFFEMLDSPLGRKYAFPPYEKTIKQIEEIEKKQKTIKQLEKMGKKQKKLFLRFQNEDRDKWENFLGKICHYLKIAYNMWFFNPLNELLFTNEVFYTTHATYREANIKRSYFDLYIPENAPMTFEKRIENMKDAKEYKNEVNRIMGLPETANLFVVRKGEISKRVKERLYDHYKLLFKNQVLEPREIKLFSNNMYEILKIIKKYWGYSDEWYSWMRYI
jgi:hypothetical protein